MSTALAKKDQVTTIRDLLSKNNDSIKLALPKHMNAERMQRTVLTACLQNPDLYESTQQSLMLSVLRAAQMGLEPDGIVGYLVPYKDHKAGKTIAQFLPSFRGMVQLARQSGEIASVTARAVRKGDDFDFELGTTEFIKHKPLISDDDEGREITYVYAVAHFRDKDSKPQFDVMTKAQVERIRARSKAKSERSPWFTDWEEMAKKTVVKRLMKMLPISVHLQQALLEEDAMESGTPLVSDLKIVVDDVAPVAKVSKLDAVVAARKEEAGEVIDEKPLDPFVHQEPASTREPNTGADVNALKARALMGEDAAIDELASMGMQPGALAEINIDRLPKDVAARYRAWLSPPKKGA